MSGYVGYINCPDCGYQHIKDIKQVKLWFALDAKEQICQITCPGCKKLKTSRIDIEDFIAFRTHGVKLTPLSEMYKPLTEEDITSWDCQKEFRLGFENLI